MLAECHAGATRSAARFAVLPTAAALSPYRGSVKPPTKRRGRALSALACAGTGGGPSGSPSAGGGGGVAPSGDEDGLSRADEVGNAGLAACRPGLGAADGEPPRERCNGSFVDPERDIDSAPR